MKRHLVRILIGVLLVARPADAAAEMILKLTVLRAGIVRLDGEDWLDMTGESGRGPVPWSEFSIQAIPIPAGSHVLALRPRDRQVLPPFEEVRLTGSDGDTVHAELGRPALLSSPSGARVLIGGREIGSTPIHLDPQDLWGADLLVDLTGYRRVTIRGDSLLEATREAGSKRLELEPLSPMPPAQVFAGERSFWSRNRTLALGTSVTLLAAGVYTAVRFKDRADERYDDYLRTGNRERQNDLFHDAVRFDRLSLLGWAVGEAAFLASFFLIIHEEPRDFVPTAAVDLEPSTGEARYRLGVRHEF